MKVLAKHILYIALAVAAACGKSGTDDPENPVQPQPAGPAEVTFTTEVRTRVRRSDVVAGFVTGDAMTLFRAAGGGQQASACKIACSEDVWRGTPAVMLDPRQTAAFQAVYPYIASAADPAAYPVSVAAQTDYLYSGPAVTVESQSPRAMLTMRHAQAVLAFNIRSYVGGELSRIELDDETFPLEGAMNLTDGRIAVSRCGPYAFDCSRSLAQEGWTSDHPSCFVFPRTMTAGQSTAVFHIDGQEHRAPLPAMEFVAGNKYILELSLTGQGAVFLPERTQIVALDADGGAAGDDYGCLKVTFRKSVYTLPPFVGKSVYGMIYWDAASAEPYSAAATHSYSTDGPHTVAIDLWRADGVEFSDLAGIEQIDLSQF